MQKYSIVIENVKAEARPAANPDGTLYLASEVDARIAELEAALKSIADPLALHTIQEMREIAKTVL